MKIQHSGHDEKKILQVEGQEETSENPATKPSTFITVFWIVFWFSQNASITFLNKHAMKPIKLPVTLTFVHMVINSVCAYVYVHVLKQVKRKPLLHRQKNLLFYFSMIFVSNIVTGNWSLGTVSISFNQVMRALIPGTTVALSIVLLNKVYSIQRKLSLLPVACGVILACGGDNSFTNFGLFITTVAIVFASIKAVLSSKFLSGSLKLHPVDLILHQAPLSAMWCAIMATLTGEVGVIWHNPEGVVAQLPWFVLTGLVSFTLNISSFYTNKMTSALTLTVLGNMKQILVIFLSITYNNDFINSQKFLGIILVLLGGTLYSVIGYHESRG